MKKLLPILAVALLAIGTISIHAQTTSVALNIGPSGHNCGVYNPNSYYCYGLPVVTVTDGIEQYGSLWTDNYATSFGNKGFVLFSGVNIGKAVIESVTPVPGGISEQLSGTGYTGTLTLYFTTYYSRGSGGRGCGGCGTKWIILPSSTITIEWK